MSEATHEVHLHDPQTLYRRWEESQWSPWEFELATDREQWETMEEDDAMADVVRGILRDLLPAVAASLTPPEGGDASVLGASADDLRGFALDGLTRRLNIIGVPLDTL
jgi:hypothetical protein